MKYAFVARGFSALPTGGVQYQGLMWKNALEKLDNKVDLVGSFWSGVNLADYDAVIIFMLEIGCRSYVKAVADVNPNVIVAPIIDPKYSDKLFKFFCKYWGSVKYLGLSSGYHDMWLARKYPKLWLVRSDQERHYVNYCLEIPQEKIATVPLNYRIPNCIGFPDKENFCFHASRLHAANKNVPRIIEAAKKYGFQLKLSGYLEHKNIGWLQNLIGGASNIEYVGRLTAEGLLDMYKRAKVLALPSLQEGVGMVALEAAAYGCEIVLTSYGAPKQYFKGQAILVDPKSVDEIGQGIMKALNEGYAQPKLKTFIENNYSEESCGKLLDATLKDAVSK